MPDMTYHPDEHPSYCMICNHPNYNGFDVCDSCERSLDDAEDNDDWAGMDLGERTRYVCMQIENGNLTDAINFMMHDGDVRADSVKLGISTVVELMTIQVRSPFAVRDQLIRLIDTWETQ